MALEIIERLRQEDLADELVRRIALDSREQGVLKPISVIVQNAGLGRWLQLRHARTCGVSAGLSLPFARSQISQLLERVDLFDAHNSLSADSIRWQIFAVLREREFESWGEDAAPLFRYLRGDHVNLERRCWQLAGQVSELYDRYEMYRPEWMLAWLNGELSSPKLVHWKWQVRLLRTIMESLDVEPLQMQRRMLGLALHDFCRNSDLIIECSSPLHVFGLSGFPPLFLRFFEKLGATNSIALYHLVTSEAFLGDLPRSYREALSEVTEFEDGSEPLSDLLNNPLLVANGQASARFQSLMLALNFPIGDHPDHRSVASSSDLDQLQLALRHNLGSMSLVGDGSISIHSCHSPLREIQVLQQQLLALFAADETLRPEDILVLAPEISEYADFIESVFGLGVSIDETENHIYIPYCIADQRSAEDATCWRFFSAFLGLLKGRQAFSEVAVLLDFEPICDQLQMSRDDLKEMQALFYKVGARWGVDGEARASQGYPDFDAYSWSYGLEQVYDGMLFPRSSFSAMGKGAQPRSGLSIGNSSAERIGQFNQLLRPLFEFVRNRNQVLDFSSWINELVPLLRSMLGDDGEGGRWMRLIVLGFSRIRSAATETPFTFEMLAEVLGDIEPEPSGSSGLLRRGITFCRLQPVRHIPARVICILGMNEGAYPRQARVSEFDLIHSQRLEAELLQGGSFAYQELNFLGDHRLRDEDRQLFLDCVLNARERLYLSYVGQSDQDNEAIPPSLLLSELKQFLEVASQGFKEDRRGCIDFLCIDHPLQEWSPRNFNRLQPDKGEAPVSLHFDLSFRTELSKIVEPKPFLVPRFSMNEDSDDLLSAHDLDVKDLIRFLADPAQYYLKNTRRVDLNQLDWMEVYEDDEALEIDGLYKWQLRSDLVSEWMRAKSEGLSFEAFLRALKCKFQASLRLPPGVAGETLWEAEVCSVLRLLESFWADRVIKRHTFRVTLESLNLQADGWLVDDSLNVLFINGKLNGKHLLDGYARYIIGNRRFHILNLKTKECYISAAPEAAALVEGYEWLNAMDQLFRSGALRPIPFSILIAEAYTNLIEKDGGADTARSLNQAYESHWESYQGGQDASASQRLCFNGDSPAAPNSEWRADFSENAALVFSAPLRWLSKLEKGGGV